MTTFDIARKVEDLAAMLLSNAPVGLVAHLGAVEIKKGEGGYTLSLGAEIVEVVNATTAIKIAVNELRQTPY